jgi:hypothetical protein
MLHPCSFIGHVCHVCCAHVVSLGTCVMFACVSAACAVCAANEETTTQCSTLTNTQCTRRMLGGRGRVARLAVTDTWLCDRTYCPIRFGCRMVVFIDSLNMPCGTRISRPCLRGHCPRRHVHAGRRRQGRGDQCVCNVACGQPVLAFVPGGLPGGGCCGRHVPGCRRRGRCLELHVHLCAEYVVQRCEKHVWVWPDGRHVPAAQEYHPLSLD